MAWLLRNRKHEDNDAGMGRLASPEDPDVHLEAMEEAESESREPDETGYAKMEGLSERQFPQGILGGCRKRHPHPYRYE